MGMCEQDDIPTQLQKRKKALKVREVSELLALSTSKIYELIDHGHLPAFRIAGAIRIDPNELAKWLQNHRV